MELRQELKMHVADMTSAFKSFKDWRPTWKWAVAILAVLTIYAAGFLSGLSMEMREGAYRSQRSDASLRMMEAAAEAKGNTLVRDRLRSRSADSAVIDYVAQAQVPLWRQPLEDFLYVKVLRLRVASELELKVIKTIAEQRLTYVAKPQPETLEELRQRGATDVAAGLAGNYAKEAQAYSVVLGREVTPAELLTDADLKTHLRMLDAQRLMSKQ